MFCLFGDALGSPALIPPCSLGPGLGWLESWVEGRLGVSASASVSPSACAAGLQAFLCGALES